VRVLLCCLLASIVVTVSCGHAAADLTSSPAPAGWIPASDPQVLQGLSPLNWVRKDGFISTSGGGSSLQVAFKGTNKVELVVDTTVDKIASPEGYPVVAWSVNGGETQRRQLSAGEKTFSLSEGVPDPVIDLYAAGFSPFENRYGGDVPPNSLKIDGFQADPGATVHAVTEPAKLWLNIGDSIMSGDASLSTSGQGRPPGETWAARTDARASYGYLLAQHYGYRESRIAYGGYDWGGAILLPGLSTLADQITSTVRPKAGRGSDQPRGKRSSPGIRGHRCLDHASPSRRPVGEDHRDDSDFRQRPRGGDRCLQLV
jgi:hypothetical protein